MELSEGHAGGFLPHTKLHKITSKSLLYFSLDYPATLTDIIFCIEKKEANSL